MWFQINSANDDKAPAYGSNEKSDMVKKSRGRRGGKGRQPNPKPLMEQNVNVPKEPLNYINAS